jgi:hypothetical protein
MVTLLRLPALRSAYLRRGLIVWGALRLALGAGFILNPVFAVKVLLLVVVALTVILDARYRKEDLFLGNLGIPVVAAGLCALPLPLIAELLLP